MCIWEKHSGLSVLVFFVSLKGKLGEDVEDLGQVRIRSKGIKYIVYMYKISKNESITLKTHSKKL